MRYFKAIAISVLLCVSFTANAAHIVVFNTIINGEQANAGLGTNSNAKGAGTMTLNLNTNEFSWFVAWQGLFGPPVAAHFHGAATPVQNAGVQVPIDIVNPSIGMATLTSQQINDLLAGLWYVNIHTSMFPGGEIRGQVLSLSPIPVPGAIWLMGGALLGFGGMMRRR